MAQFKFEAKSMNGQNLKGEIDASNEAEARVKLRAKKLIPIRVFAKSGGSAKSTVRGKSVKSKELQVFTRQLSTLLNSGIPVVQSLETLARSTTSPTLANTLNRIVEDLGAGRRLGDALAQHPRVFDGFYVNMVKAGEEGGVLDTVLQRLAEYIEKSVRIIGKIKSSMIYPSVIIAVSFAVIAVIMIFVIPKFEEMFSGMGKELPALTQMVIHMSRFFCKFWYLIIGSIIGGIFGLMSYYRTPPGKKAVDRVMIDFPLIGNVLQKGAIARFTRTLSTLLGAGVGIMEAMDISAKVVGNHVIEAAFLRAKDALSQGRSMTTTLSREKYVPLMVCQMIGIGEQTGNLDTMLSKVADFFEEEVDNAVGAMTAAMEPLLMVILGGIIGTLVIAMYLPIFNLAAVVG